MFRQGALDPSRGRHQEGRYVAQPEAGKAGKMGTGKSWTLARINFNLVEQSRGHGPVADTFPK